MSMNCASLLLWFLIHRRILDNGLIFTARRFRAACRDYRLAQEFIMPYTPVQNGMIERFFRSLKEECVWQHDFADYAEAWTAIARWIRWHNERRPHQARGHLSPHQYGAQQLQAVSEASATRAVSQVSKFWPIGGSYAFARGLRVAPTRCRSHGPSGMLARLRQHRGDRPCVFQKEGRSRRVHAAAAIGGLTAAPRTTWPRPCLGTASTSSR